jgi:hypothetical protein
VSYRPFSSSCANFPLYVQQYNTHFFVNQYGANGPESHWVHPNEQERSKASEKQPASYAPPSGPPPGSHGAVNGGGSASSAPQQGYASSNNSDGKKGGGGFLGKLLAKAGSSGQSGGYGQQPGRYQQQREL